jgi:hypothetical protein
MMTSVTSRATFQNSDVIFIWLDISNFENNAENISKFKGKMSVVYRVRIDLLPPMLSHFSLLKYAVSRD